MKLLSLFVLSFALLVVTACKQKQGLQTAYHENGQKKRQTNYVDGKKHGLETWWDMHGNVIGQFNFENGKKVE